MRLLRRQQAAAAESALLVSAEMAALCSVSEASWWRLLASGKTPAPVKLQGRTLWDRAELATWVPSGCPPRKEWEARRGTGQR
jgi:predicted DNA-binding transcriptional regulator AlpA